MCRAIVTVFCQLILTCPISPIMDKYPIKKDIAIIEIYSSASLQRIKAMPNSASQSCFN